MGPQPDIVERVRTASAKRRLYLAHALRQMARPDRMIATKEFRTVMNTAIWSRITQTILAGTAA
jgi:hypothetical protein